jgi:hypothetical protein
MVAISIVRSVKFLQVKGEKTFVSTTFIVTLENATIKYLNLKSWTLTSLLKPCENGQDIPMNKDNCALFYRNWANQPTFGNFKKDYPPLHSAMISDSFIRCFGELKYLAMLNATLEFWNAKDLSDAEIERCFKDCALPTKLIQGCKEMRDAGKVILSNQ